MAKFRLHNEDVNARCASCSKWMWAREAIYGVYDGCKVWSELAKDDDEPESVWVLKDDKNYMAICAPCYTKRTSVGENDGSGMPTV